MNKSLIKEYFPAMIYSDFPNQEVATSQINYLSLLIYFYKESSEYMGQVFCSGKIYMQLRTCKNKFALEDLLLAMKQWKDILIAEAI